MGDPLQNASDLLRPDALVTAALDPSAVGPAQAPGPPDVSYDVYDAGTGPLAVQYTGSAPVVNALRTLLPAQVGAAYTIDAAFPRLQLGLIAIGLRGQVTVSATLINKESTNQTKFSARRNNGRWAGELKGKILDWFKGAVRVNPGDANRPGVISLSAELQERFTIRWQTDPKAVLRGDITINKFPIPPKSSPPWHLDSIDCDVAGSIDVVAVIEIGAGDELLNKFKLTEADLTAEGALTDTAIAGLGPLDVALLIAGIIVGWLGFVISDIENAQNDTLSWGVTLGDRNGFAAQIALAITGADTSELDTFLDGWKYTTPESHDVVLNAVLKGRLRAQGQLQALSPADYATRIQSLTDKYGKIPSTGKPDPDFRRVATNLLVALGGVDRNGPPATLDSL